VPDAGAAVAVLEPWLQPEDVVLVKASRVVALDQVAERLLRGPSPGPDERGS
jgi:UDP-N-acetylmuramyl pentapeptide synthase